jgi:MbtH protein
MLKQEEEDLTIYNVVVNHEEQYSIWPQDRENPLGWRSVGKSGTKAGCLEYIKEVWTDMRPLSLRKQMEADQRAADESSRELLAQGRERSGAGASADAKGTVA